MYLTLLITVGVPLFIVFAIISIITIILVPKLIDHTAHINKEPIIQGSGIRVFAANQPAAPPSTNKNTVYKRLFLNEIPLLK